jgi:hypothetical protein
MKRTALARKSNVRERRFEIGDPNGGFKPPLLEVFAPFNGL